MGLFKSSKKSSNKAADKVVSSPTPEEPPAVPEPEVVVAPAPTAEPTPTYLSPFTFVDTPLPEYTPPPPPPNGKGFVSPLASWLEEYGSGPFLSRDGGKPQYPGKKENGDETSSSGDAPASDREVTEAAGKKSQGKGKEGREASEPSEFTKVKRSSGRSASVRADTHDGYERSSRSSRDRDSGRLDDRKVEERHTRSRATSRASDSSHHSDRSSEKDGVQVADKSSKDRDSKVASRRRVVDDKDADLSSLEAEDRAPRGTSPIKAPKSKPVEEQPSEKQSSNDGVPTEKPKSSAAEDDLSEAPQSKSDAAAEVDAVAANATAADKEAIADAEPAEVKEALADEIDAADVNANSKDAGKDNVKDKDESDIEPEQDVVDGKKIRVLDTGDDAADEVTQSADSKDLPDKDSELVLLKDKLKQLQQKLSEERAEKLELQKKVKDRDREIFSLSKQLDKLEAQAERYERLERFGGEHSASRGSLLDNDMAMSERDMRSADDLQVALKAFKEHSNAKLQETFKQNADLRHQVESYETLCRTIGEVLRDYEWLQQCRIVTGDLDYSRLRKAMMKLWHTGKTRAVLPVVAMVLAFGPDEVSRCRHVLNSAKQDADMVDYIPEIIEHNMDETMKRDAITVYIDAHKQLTEDTEIALYLTDRFAERYKGEWHCVVGEQYALSSCYESKVIKFKSGHRSVILWSN